jgi:molybdopterin biosynthesis enzyme
MQGARGDFPSYHLEGLLENEYFKDPERRQYLFCEVGEYAGGYLLRVIRPQGSAMLGMASRAAALAVAPIGTASLKPGDRLAFRWLK